MDGDLAFSVPGQERVQICVRDPKNTIEPVGCKRSGVDPAANRPGRDTQRFRDVGYGEKPHTVCAIAPSANCVSEVNLRFQGSIMSHVNVPGSDFRAPSSTAPSRVGPESLWAICAARRLAGALNHSLKCEHRHAEQPANFDGRYLTPRCGVVRPVPA
jgi:hypothetical protein